jgi:hypothetical protein
VLPSAYLFALVVDLGAVASDRERMGKKKVRVDPRAQRSGFGEKLAAFLAYARRDYERGRRTGTPRNARQLSKWLTEHGEPAAYTAVLKWSKSRSMPASQYVGLSTSGS